MKRYPSKFSPQERIEIDSIPEPNSGCWIWLASTNQKGYAHFRYRKVQHRASRFAWKAYKGPIPEGLLVLHRCDNRLCVNPDHLFLGTDQDNADDKIRKGRAGINTNAIKTHCKYGHEYKEENTYRQKNTLYKQRACLTCRRLQTAKYNLNRKNWKEDTMLISAEYPSKYLKSDDLKGKQIKLIMAHVDREKIGEDSRPVLYFKGIEKGLVLNKTNSYKIKETYGDDTEEWAGQPIILFAIMTDFKGETVQGIRVRAPTAKEMQPVATVPPKNVFPPDKISSDSRDKFVSGLPSEFPDEYLEER